MTMMTASLSASTDNNSNSNMNSYSTTQDGLVRSLAEDMNSLSVKERELVYEEIHGVADIIEETPALVSSSLFEMSDALVHTPKKEKRALDRALFLRPDIAKDDKLHLLFLRAERFDPKKAARKMCRYFDHKMELFGYEKLVKKITLDDLGEQEMQAMQEGSFQFIPVNHQGLQAVFTTSPVMDDLDWKATTRYIFYQVMAALEDEEVQKRGIVVIPNFCGEWKRPLSKTIEFTIRSAHITTDLPFRTRCVHYLCPNNQAIQGFVGLIHNILPLDLRLREKLHFGSELELQYALRHYGIRLSDCFEAEEGLFSKRHIGAYLEHRRQKEAEFELQEQQEDHARSMMLKNSRFVPYPNRTNDVLMGRGRPYQEWPSNARLGLIVAQHAPRYLQAKRRIEKTTTTEYILEHFQNVLGGRFLQRTDSGSGWEVGDDAVAKEKIAQLLRAEVRAAKGGGAASSDEHHSEEEGNASKRPRIE